MSNPCLTHLVLYIIFFSLFPWVAQGDLVNHTIDDTKGDSATGQTVTYLPETPDGAPWATPNCPVCVIKPDLQRAFDNTYRAATWYPANDTMSISINFNGVAVYVFFILVNNIGIDITTLTLANFTLDEGEPELFQHTPDPSNSDILYNQLVYNRENLENTQHSLVVSASKVVEPVYVNFDYVIYTHDDEAITPTAPVSSQTPVFSATMLPTSMTLRSITSNMQPILPTTALPSQMPILPTQEPRRALSRASIAGSVAGGIVVAAVSALIVALWIRRQRGIRQMERPSQFPMPTQQVAEDSLLESGTFLERQAVTSVSGPRISDVGEKDVQRSERLLSNSPTRTEYSATVPSEAMESIESHSIPEVTSHANRTAGGKSEIDSALTPRQSGDLRDDRPSTTSSQVQGSSSTEGLLEYMAGPPPEYKP